MPGTFADTFGIVEAVSVTPNDGNLVFPSGPPARGLYVGVSGDVRVQLLEGGAVTLVGLASGIWHPVVVTRVLATGTTATGILAGR